MEKMSTETNPTPEGKENKSELPFWLEVLIYTLIIGALAFPFCYFAGFARPVAVWVLLVIAVYWVLMLTGD